jgi:hypothetical protein
MPSNDPNYAKNHYQANKQDYLDRAKAHNRARRDKFREIIRSAKDVPCTDCGIKYPYYVMHFDHIGEEKNFNIGAYIAKSISEERLRAEIALCEVVCANCHAERTHQRSTDTQNRTEILPL